jgi:alkanesulfonate monooxygenase SsuD/methylene tetrahydromethanopterin reductase-like flavin-dependent oxidoreductase (luciferase family)
VERRFGILTFQGGPFAQIVAEWRRAEELGFGSAYLVDTLAPGRLADFEAWVSLAALARETSRIRIGTLVTILPLRHPAILAAQAITVDHASGGRLEVGIGPGDDAGDHAAVGAEPWSTAERVERFAEQLTMLDASLRGGRTTHTGRYYRSEDLELPLPAQRPRPPIIVAAQGPRTIALAARFADGWNSMGGQPAGPAARIPLPEAVARTKEQVATLAAACADIRRDPAAIRHSVLAFRVEHDPLSSIDAFDDFVGRYAEIGMDEFVFYWPPLATLRRRETVTPEVRGVFERIAAERLSG